ncbi:acetoacetate--CoA ligase [Parendozoicomonas haliclonae]|uniref:Acetyl-coenzyme A synthetase n=1 Tax=Parendozoicomonas haliclonae TaxID=1960125 RepID=A0A1X7AL48_9GAMM|nr:acetoacetate--CoA ligase [Parendozoicomonas haliclonae]SMA47894.1 Acetyl-coenzyme A synthetase [Parendozoicomonas haliclonae]
MLDKPLWSPSPESIRRSQMQQCLEAVQSEFGLSLTSYHDLHQWSCQHPELFWPFLAQFLDLPVTDYQQVVAFDNEQASSMEGAHWFTGSQINYAEAMLRFQGDQTAIVYRGEDGSRRELSRNQLRELVARAANGLRAAGIREGDRIAGFMPNMPETIAMMLAAASLGAVWSSCSPDFGSQGVLDRFGQIEPRILVATDGYQYSGKSIDCRPRIQELVEEIPSIERVVIVPFGEQDLDIRAIEKSTTLADFLSDDTTLRFSPLPFDHPLCILYSSGTTGKPKCIVHGHGGTLLQHAKELCLHTDLREGEKFFYFSTCGWMMWNWLASGLITGATLVLFDGSPFHPGPEALWQMAEQEQISVFGTSARYLTALQKSGFEPAKACKLPALRAILSTGSPLPHEGFDFVYESIGRDLMLSSISGGTDIISCFALGNPILPVYRGQLQCLGLGMNVAFYDDEGQSVLHQPGELVCQTAFPSRPVMFWNDPDSQRYHDAYYSRFQNIWAHGDYGEITPEQGVILHGRSDAVLNPGGVRIGTAEIYRQVEKVEAVLESLAVGQQFNNDERVVLFVRLRDGLILDQALEQQIRSVIRTHASPRHVPAVILQAPDLPRTVSGKLTELAVKAIIHGRPVKNAEALANPETLTFFKDLDALRV